MTLVTLEALLSNWINLEQSLWRQQSSPAEQGLHTRDSFTDLEQSFIFQSIQEQTGTDQFYPEV